VGRARAVGS